jgi:hypothetical protein
LLSKLIGTDLAQFGSVCEVKVEQAYSDVCEVKVEQAYSDAKAVTTKILKTAFSTSSAAACQD